jgi:transcriptional regulator with XRE-family HTH domain
MWRMPVTPASVRIEARRRVRRHARRLGESIEHIRVGGGLSKADLARAASIHPTHLTRIERGDVIASVPVLTAIGVALGCDLGIRLFADVGPSIHDRHQAPMVEALLRILPSGRWRPRLEVAVTRPRRGVIDMTLEDRTAPLTIAVEFQSMIGRVEETLRWQAEKADGLAAAQGQTGSTRQVDRLLVLRSTADMRELIDRFERTFATAYPARSADVVAALTTADAPWPGSGIAWMRVEGGQALLLPGPPRGVRLGR